ncbi:hypothetical protein HZS_6187 [Henneguya salminicola]|nr:hypothetical protein HZS_6187 [Henneguya salminicola]
MASVTKYLDEINQKSDKKEKNIFGNYEIIEKDDKNDVSMKIEALSEPNNVKMDSSGEKSDVELIDKNNDDLDQKTIFVNNFPCLSKKRDK